MLVSLHIQNIGLIDNIEIPFRRGLNVLSGETGAGKSMIIGSLDALLGGEMAKSLKREEDSFIEGVFALEGMSPAIFDCLEELGLSGEQELIISRKVSGGRSVFRCNGQMITKAAALELRARLLDIHSQREHQSLLQVKNHILMLDRYFAKEITPLLEELRLLDKQRREAEKALAELNMEESARLREVDFLQFEIKEIEEADLKPGEDQSLEQELEVLQNSRQIQEALQAAMEAVAGEYGSRNQVGQAAYGLQRVKDYDERLMSLWEQLLSAEDILHDVAREAERYLDTMDGYEERLFEAEERMDVINSLKAKHGNTIEEILAALPQKAERLAFLEDIVKNRQRRQRQMAEIDQKMQAKAGELTAVRQKAAAQLKREMEERLGALNFNNNQFEVKIERKKQVQADGWDEAAFYISTNKGEALKPLVEIASGGELSRIMLAMKGIFAAVDEIPSLIFDEIDTGISGITAGMVGEQMKRLAAGKQIFAISHLPQIVALGDAHYLIYKEEVQNHTRTEIIELDSEARVKELARLLGGKNISKAVEDTAREMLGLTE
ncbi:DNA repair protein RecN [Lachnospiraceae bacterium oral taxon 500]|nr:DNA repair protein RecN [Lachnospiraceae bacterium oral taxon 500]